MSTFETIREFKPMKREQLVTEEEMSIIGRDKEMELLEKLLEGSYFRSN